MTGLAGSITPAYTGTIVISGAIASGTTGDGAKVQASYGTGGAPSNAATITGTQCGGRPIYTAAAAGSDKVPFSVNCVVTGLTVGTAYWIDATLAAVTGGTASIANVSVSAYEL
jgi:hypothetical protein